MGISRMPLLRQLPMMHTIMTALAVIMVLTTTTQGARIFRSPEPHLPADNVPALPSSPTERRPHDTDVLSPPVAASAPRSAGDDSEGYFAPGAWRPVRDPDYTNPGRARISSRATSELKSNQHVVSARNLRHEDGGSVISSDARTSESSPANSPTTTLGHSIALVANQLLQSKADILESRVPEASTTGSLKEGVWTHTSLDMRTPPKLMQQISGQKNGAAGTEEPNKKVAPIPDDPMGENFFPSRSQPTTVTQKTTTTPGAVVTQMMVSTMSKNQPKENVPTVPSSTPIDKKEDKRPLTSTTPSTTVSYKRTSPTSSIPPRSTTPLPSSVAYPTHSSVTPSPSSATTSVKWKIAMPPNRQATRFPPRKPPSTTTVSPMTTLSTTETIKKESKPVNNAPSSSRPNAGGFIRPVTILGTSRRPTQSPNRAVTTATSIKTTPQPIILATTPHPSFKPMLRPITTTTTQKPTSKSSTTRPTVDTSHPNFSTTTKQVMSSSSTVAPAKDNVITQQPKKPLASEVDIVKVPSPTVEVIKTETSTKTEVPLSSTTARPRRPSNKRKKNKNKNRRRNPAKKPAATPQVDSPSSGTELELKESPQGEETGNVASPLSTRIYNFIAREVMPSMSVGLLGLVVTAGLAGYFLLPTLGLQRRSDLASDGLMPAYGSGGVYTGGSNTPDDEGGIVQTIFQNVMASVRNGEKEFERGPRRRRNVPTSNEAENEVDASLNIKNEQENWPVTKSADMTTTPTTELVSDLTTDNLNDPLSETEISAETTTNSPLSVAGTTTTEDSLKTDNPTQAMVPTYGWEGQYDDNPLSIMGILKRIADFKLRLGVGLLRATTDVIARYLEDVQHRLRDSDKQDWLRSLESTVRRIRRSIDPHSEGNEKKRIPHPRNRLSRLHRARRHN